MNPTPTAEEIAQARTKRGGWTRAQLAQWGVPWPPPKGWKKRLERGEDFAGRRLRGVTIKQVCPDCGDWCRGVGGPRDCA